MPEILTQKPLIEDILIDRFHLIADPIPPWLRNHLDKRQLIQLAAIEMDMRKAILEAALKATVRASEIIQTAASKAA